MMMMMMVRDVCMDGCLLRRISRTGLPPRCKGGGEETTSERGQQQQQHQGRSALGVRGHSVRRTAYSVQPGQDVRVSIWVTSRERLFCDMNRRKPHARVCMYVCTLCTIYSTLHGCSDQIERAVSGQEGGG